MTVLYFLLALLVFGVIVFAHELGHFLAARATGIGVEEFAVGFGPKLIGWQGKATKYSLRALPLGGYCRFYGEDEHSDREDAFNRQSVWKRMLTVVSGPLMNFILAYLVVLIFLMAVGSQYALPQVGELTPGLGAEAAGMQVGDVIVEVEGQAIAYSQQGYLDMLDLIQQADPAQPINMVIERDGAHIDMAVSAKQVDESYQIGISLAMARYRFGLGEGLSNSFLVIKENMQMMLDALLKLFTTGEGIEDTGGPVMLMTVMTQSVRQGLETVVLMVMIISLNLGVINLLPLPALDGGRLVFLLLEAVRRKPIKPEYEGWVHAAGMLLLMGLIVVITYQDITRLIAG